jgi:hypothetical protein
MSKSVSWRTYVDTRFDASEKAVASALAAAEKAVAAALSAAKEAVTKAEAAQSKRDDASNEIRGAMVDQQKNFASAEKVDAAIARIGRLENQQATMGGKYQGIALVVLGIATLASLLIGAASLLK